MTSKKKKVVAVIIIAPILLGMLINSNIINKPRIIVYVHGEMKEISGAEYNGIIGKVDEIFKGEMERTKSEFDKQEEKRCKNFKSIEVIYPYPKLRLVKVEDRVFNFAVDFSSKILIPLDKQDSSYELFTCYGEYTSGGWGFCRTEFTDFIYSLDKKTFD